MNNRKFELWSTSNRETQEVTRWIVTDVTDEEVEISKRREKAGYGRKTVIDVRPPAAEFPVSMLYDSDTQYRRAKMVCDYLNRINRVTEQAIANETLIDALTVNPTP